MPLPSYLCAERATVIRTSHAVGPEHFQTLEVRTISGAEHQVSVVPATAGDRYKKGQAAWHVDSDTHRTQNRRSDRRLRLDRKVSI